MNLFDRSFKSGVIWNLFSFTVMGVSGLLLNILVARFYEPWVLGVFNLVFAIYIFISQIAVMGIHQSTLRHVSVLYHETHEVEAIVSVGLFLTIACSILVSGGVWLCRDSIATIFDNQAIKISLENVALGLFLFPLNKVLLAALNGCRRMRAYAVGNAVRYIFILGAVIWAIMIGLPGERLAIVFSIAEGVLFLGLLVANRHVLKLVDINTFVTWIHRHLVFGVKGVGGGVLNELNTRVDVLMLGLFVDATAVGIYSFAAIIAEGIGQLLTVFRVNYDPVLARLVNERKWDQLKSTISDGRTVIYKFMIVIGLVAITLYPWVVKVVTNKQDYNQSWLVFTILVCGIVISAGFTPFGGILQQSGHPGVQSILISVAVFVNIFGNLVLIPLMGITGAAIAPSMAQVAFVIMLKYLVRSTIGKKLL